MPPKIQRERQITEKEIEEFEKNRQERKEEARKKEADERRKQAKQEADEEYRKANTPVSSAVKKNEEMKRRGRGIFDIQESYNKVSRDTLEKYGGQYIQKMKISRAPIPSLISKAVNFVSRGKSGEIYDDLFHLSLIVTLDSKDVIIEKNEVVNVSTEYEMTEKRDLMDVPMLGRKITLNELLNKTLSAMGSKKYFEYEAFQNNCQVYIDEILKSNHLLNHKLHDFLFQDMEEIITKTPWLARKFASFVTTTASLWNKLTGGKKEDIPKHLVEDLLKFCMTHKIDVDHGFDAWFKTLDKRIQDIIK